MEFAELYVKDTDQDLVYSIFEKLKSNNRVIDPQMSTREDDGHTVITCGFKGKYHKNLVVEKMSKEFPLKISWR